MNRKCLKGTKVRVGWWASKERRVGRRWRRRALRLLSAAARPPRPCSSRTTRRGLCLRGDFRRSWNTSALCRARRGRAQLQGGHTASNRSTHSVAAAGRAGCASTSTWRCPLFREPCRTCASRCTQPGTFACRPTPPLYGGSGGTCAPLLAGQ